MRTSTALTVLALSAAACTPDLTWTGEKTYTVPSETLRVEGLGVDSDVEVLSAPTFSVARPVVNQGTVGSAGVTAREEIVRWIFQAAGGSAGWVPGNTAADTVFRSDMAVAPLGPGAVDTVSFGPIGPLGCGLYEQVLTVDVLEDEAESDEGNNVAHHFFFVPSAQQFNIAVDTILESIAHDAGPVNTHDFVVTPAGATAWTFGHFSFVATEGSSATADPSPPQPGGPGPQVIDMLVTPTTHAISPGFQPTVTGKVTVISNDGCVVKQQTARVLVEHDVR